MTYIRLINNMVTELKTHVNYFQGIYQKPIKLEIRLQELLKVAIGKNDTTDGFLSFIAHSCL